MSFELAQQVADAVLYEGYVLYPYRASATKNRFRWQFGVVVPRAYSEAGGGEPWVMQTECLVQAETAPALEVRVRFLQLQHRTIEEAVDAEAQVFRPVERLEVGGRQLVTWEEGIEIRIDVPILPLSEIFGGGRLVPLAVPGGHEVELVSAADGRVTARIVRERWPISGTVHVAVERLEQPAGLVKVRIRIENLSPWPKDAPTTRELALRHALNGAHTLLAIHNGTFVSLFDAPDGTAEAVRSCANLHTWPVLIGQPGAHDVMLSSPIILYDYPGIAPESPGDLCDATEIDEILTLRIMTLTDEEKREARGTDERARRIIERSDSMPAEVFERLHGAVRSITTPDPPPEPPPEEAWVEIGGQRVRKGSRVRLQPTRRADAMDMFLKDRVALVEGVYRDVEDATYVAVILDDDPAGDLHRWYGRFFYFYPDEIEPFESDADTSMEM